MLQLVLDRNNPTSFEKLASQFLPMIRKVCTPFSRDSMLSRFEDAESLSNLCLSKLQQAQQDFVYRDDIPEKENEYLFIALVRKYITNILIDKQYLANLRIRSPKTPLINLPQIDNGFDGDEEGDYQPEDFRCSNPGLSAQCSEILRNIRSALSPDENRVLNQMIAGYPAEGIARKLGIPIGRVRYLIYNKIQPCAREQFG